MIQDLDNLPTLLGTAAAGGAGTSVHNDLTSIQGGLAAERYHLAKANYDAAILGTYDAANASVELSIPNASGGSSRPGRGTVLRVFNNTGVQLDKGCPVRIQSLNLGNGVYEAVLARSNEMLAAQETIGVMQVDTADQAIGVAVNFGEVAGVDTSAFPVDSILYVSADTQGEYIVGAPPAPYYPVRVGRVAVSDATNGVIGIDVFTFNSSDTEVNIQGLLDGTLTQTQDTAVVVEGGEVYLDVSNEEVSGADLPFILEGKRYFLNSTTGAGAGGAARVQLVQGVQGSPVLNYVWVDNTPSEGTLHASATRPAGVVAYVGIFTIEDDVQTAAEGALIHHRFNNSVQGFNFDLATWIRLRPATYLSGVDPTVTINTGPSPDSVKVSTSAGIVSQFHPQTYDVQDGTRYYVVNDPVEPFKVITDLNEITVDAQGNSLLGNNTRFSLTFFGVQNSPNGVDRLLVTLPNGSYSSDISCINDVSNLKVTSLPSGLDLQSTAFRICSICLKVSGGGGTFENILGAGAFQDERGFPFGSAGGGSGSTSGGFSTLGANIVLNNIVVGKTVYFRAESAIDVSRWTLMANAVGDIEVGITVDGSPPPSTSITGGNNPSLTAAQFGEDDTLTGWTTLIPAGSYLGVTVISATTITDATLCLRVDKI